MSKKTKISDSLNKLKKAVPLAYTSNFDFGTSEITQSEKDSLIKNESIFIKKFKECSAAKYEMCRALYEINLVLKESHTFVDWYKSIGMTKDKVYELLNRYKLYLAFTGDNEKLEWVTSLSELAVTYLSRKYVEHEDLYEAFEKGLKKAVDIEIFLEDKKYRREIQNNNKLGFINNDSPCQKASIISESKIINNHENIFKENTNLEVENRQEDIQVPLFKDLKDENHSTQEIKIINKNNEEADILRNIHGNRLDDYDKYRNLLFTTSDLKIVDSIKIIIENETNTLIKFLKEIEEKEKVFDNLLPVGTKLEVIDNGNDNSEGYQFNVGTIHRIAVVDHNRYDGLRYKLETGHILDKNLIFDTYHGVLIKFKKVE